MADKLTPQQEAAVRSRGGNVLVSAAAGSGKTKVLVDRLLGYLTDPADPANLDDFLIITYTKAAAAELRGKIAAKLTERIAQEPENRHLQKQMQRLYLTQISTVHSFCTNLLREYAYRLDLGADFRVADENECAELRETVLKDLMDRAYETMGTDASFCAFVDSQGVGRNDGQVPLIIQKVYDSARCHLDPNGWLDKCLADCLPEGRQDASETVWGRFLMDELNAFLDSQIGIFSRCSQASAEYSEFVKVTENLDGTIAQLQHLRDSGSWDELRQRKDIQYGTLRFPKKNPDLTLTEEIKAVREACKTGLKRKLRNFEDDSARILGDLTQSAAAAEGLIRLVRQFEQDYRAAKRSRRVLDFGDLEHRTLDLLLGRQRSGVTAAAVEIGSRYREVMVDEYQDSNGVQDAIFTALTSRRQNCFMVGDVKQSIYQFRLADPGIFLKKYSVYRSEEAEPGEGRKILLSHNFRSGMEIIEGINDVFRTCMSPKVGGLYYGEAEALREGIPHKPLPDPAVEFYALESDEDAYAEEAAFAAGRIRKMLTEGTMVRDGDTLRPVKPEDIVILLRSPNSVGREYQTALEFAGIRCAVDGGMDLLQTSEIGTLRAFLQTVANPRQDIPLLTALASPLFGFTADELASIRGPHRKCDVFEALVQSGCPKAKAFLEVLETLRADARMLPLTELLEHCFLLTRLDGIYGAMPGGQARKANLQMFYQLAADYEKNGLRSLDQFLEYLDSLENSGLKAAGSSTAGCVTIMSIHKSKGLEFPVVFLCGLSRKFNRESVQQQVLCHKELGLGLAVVENHSRIRYSSVSKRAIAASMNAESTSEEMRVLYVAMTRARDRLVMTYANKFLENRLSDIALRLSYDGGQRLCMDASCPGDWVLIAAMQRTEAYELHAIGGKPSVGRVSDYPWKIRVVHSAVPEQEQALQEEEREEQRPVPLQALAEALAFRYAHVPATAAPSKQTATGRKGRSRAEEAQEQTREPKTVYRAWRRPTFREKTRDGRAYGNAFHSAMQFIRYECCTDEAGVGQEMERLVTQGLLTQEEASLVDQKKIVSFFASALGQKLSRGVPCLREFKFSILDNGSRYGEGLEGEQVLLQGVVDCAIVEDDGITVLDFKTDRVSEECLSEAAERYRMQIDTYADALARIYEKNVKARYLYFFHLDQFVMM